MAITTAEVAVGTTATLLAVGGAGRSDATVISVKPVVAAEGDTVFVGNDAVATTDGFPLGPGISFDLAPGEELYGVVASGTVDVRVLEHS